MGDWAHKLKEWSNGPMFLLNYGTMWPETNDKSIVQQGELEGKSDSPVCRPTFVVHIVVANDHRLALHVRKSA